MGWPPDRQGPRKDTQLLRLLRRPQESRDMAKNGLGSRTWEKEQRRTREGSLGVAYELGLLFPRRG